MNCTTFGNLFLIFFFWTKTVKIFFSSKALSEGAHKRLRFLPGVVFVDGKALIFHFTL